MRKSERLRQLELEFVKMRFEIDLLTDIVKNLLDAGVPREDMESGKWYVRKQPKNDWQRSSILVEFILWKNLLHYL